MSGLPPSWAELTLVEACNKITDGTHHSPPNAATGEFKYVTAKNIRRHGLDLADLTYVSAEVHQGIFERCPVEQGDVLYIKDGATTGLAVNNPLDEPFSLLSSVALLKPDRRLLDERYLRHWLNSPETLASMIGQMSGSAIKRLTLTTISGQRLPLPPLGEQQRIVAKLDALTARTTRARADLDRVPALAARYKQAVLAKEMAGSTDEMLPLSAAVAGGLIGLVRSKAEQSDERGEPYVRMQHFDLDGFWTTKDLTRVVATDAEIARFALREGDVLFNTRNSAELVGKVALCTADQAGLLYNNNLLRLRFKDGILPGFAYRYMQSPQFRAHLEGQKSATTSVAAIYQGSLYQTPFWVPSASRQAETVRRIDRSFAEINRMVSEAAAASRLLDRLDRAVLAKAFRGELVPQDPADEPASVLVDRIRAERASAPKATRGRRKAVTA